MHESTCSTPMEVPSSQHSTATSWADSRTQEWQAATQDRHLFFSQCPTETTKSPDTFPPCAKTSTCQQLVYSNYRSLTSFAGFNFFVSLPCITFGVFWFGILATFSYGKTYVCTGKGETERAWQEQAHYILQSYVMLHTYQETQHVFYYLFQDFS